MSIVRMRMVNVVGKMNDIVDATSAFCDNENIHAEPTSALLENSYGFTVINDSNPWKSPLDQLINLSVSGNISLGYVDYSDLNMNNEQVISYIDELITEFNSLNSVKLELDNLTSHLQFSLNQLNDIKTLNVDLDELFKCEYLKIRFGRLPKDSYEKLTIYEDNPYLIFLPLAIENKYVRGVYFTPTSSEEEIDNIFASLFYERFRISEEAHGTPTQAIADFQNRLNTANEQLTQKKNEISALFARENDKIKKIYCKIKYLQESFELRRSASKLGENFYLAGWIAEDEADNILKVFDRIENIDCIIDEPISKKIEMNHIETDEIQNDTDKKEVAENKEPEIIDNLVSPPSKLKNNRLIKPFEEFVNMYGIPAYNEIDPTALIAFNYTLLYGIMFGDVGQGLVLSLIGFLMYKYKGLNLGKIMFRVGFSSAFFGLIYGSVFGYENALTPLYKAVGITVLPLKVLESSMTNLVLVAAVGFGVVFIVLGLVLNIINGVRQKSIEKIFFSQNGLVGLVFYVSIIISVVLLLLFNRNILSVPFILLVIVIPLLIIYFKEPLIHLSKRKKDWFPKNIGEYLIVNIFELYEVVLSYITNTVSYVRIGAFALSHAGMMSVVFILAHTSHNSNNLIVVIVGNAFIIGMEGFIVGIQVLRLQFYEMFSRFYDGDGKEFTPSKIHYDQLK